MRTLQVTARNLIIISVLALLAVTSAHGQTGAVLRANVPFGFEAGGESLPAGTYRFRLRLGEGAVVMSGAKSGDIRLPIITQLGTGSLLTDATLIFDTFEGHHALSEVWIPGEEGVLVKATPKAHTHESVIAVVTGPAPKLSGKQVFERTCARCHGPKGQGNPAADKFFQTPVPKLTSALVQGKSDEELKEIISHGKGMMDPVRMGQAQVQHLLDSGSVEAVIQFVRTFKTP
jgi:cytochrome c5